MKQLSARIGSKKTLTATYATPQETLLGSPETLPTSEPGTPQANYTVAGGDLPVFSITPYSVSYIAVMMGAGKFTTAGTLYWRMKKNGSSVANGSQAVSANNYYTLNATFFGIVAGDVLEIALWSNQAGSNYDYKALSVLYSRLNPHAKRSLYLDLFFEKVDTNFTLSLGNPSATDTWAATYNPINGNNYSTTPAYECGANVLATAPIKFYGAFSSDLYGIMRSYFGDPGNAGSMKTHASYRPYYVPYKKVERISWRRVVGI